MVAAPMPQYGAFEEQVRMHDAPQWTNSHSHGGTLQALEARSVQNKASPRVPKQA